VGIGSFEDAIFQPKKWATGLANTGIINLLDIPHFGRGRNINNYAKKLMVVTHGGYLWVEDLVSIYVELIAFIKGMSSRSESPTHFLDDKKKEKELDEDMKKTYGIERGSRRIIIKHINDTTTRLANKLMACKLLRKCCKEEFPIRVIVAPTQCT
jgi:hypothetical protein